ncbi:hypothetical protein, partial [Nonomuraea basaltis]|uniref:hypothetical protein n=1 Tax=Nonomuraea basaltis TaxID=2495887 RepID=UPI00197F46B1
RCGSCSVRAATPSTGPGCARRARCWRANASCRCCGRSFPDGCDHLRQAVAFLTWLWLDMRHGGRAEQQAAWMVLLIRGP